jgi:long-chain acyl-CoA synthetase
VSSQNTKYIPDESMPASALAILHNAAMSNPKGRALVTGGKEYTFIELQSSVLAMSRHLHNHGFKPGGVAALFLEDYLDFFRAMFAVWAAGGAVMPINMSLPESLRAHLISKVGPDLAIISDDSAGNNKELKTISIDAVDFNDTANNAEAIQPACEDLAIIMFTSGSTGLPKGIPCTHKMVAGNAWLMSHILGLSEVDALFINTPCYYTSAICHLLTCFSQNAALVAERGFMFGPQIFEHIEANQCTGLGGAPAHLQKIAQTAPHAPDCLRFFMSSGDHLPPDLIRQCMRKYPGVNVFTVYGLSEVAGRLCVLEPEHLPDKIGSVGKPLPGMEVRILNEEGEPVMQGEVGEVHVKGHILMTGYLDASDAGVGPSPKKGFPTGDFGYFDEDGFLFLLGRRDDIFKSGGEKVSTLLIAEALQEMKEFSDLAVTAKSDALMGKVPIVYYVLKPDAEFNQAEIMSMLRKKLPANHIPRLFKQVDLIPRTGSGKVIRKELQ